MNRVVLVAMLLVAMQLVAQPAWAAPSPQGARGSTAGGGHSARGSTAGGGQMEIEAQSTTYDGKAHTYQVKGKVRITLPQLTVTCDEATIHAAPTEDRVLRVVFAGRVEAKRGADSFRADRITYHVAERKLVAEGTTKTRIQLPAGAQGPITGP